MTDAEPPFWPTLESAKQDMLELERERWQRVAKHYKYNDGAANATERFFRAKEIAAEQDAKRKWYRR